MNEISPNRFILGGKDNLFGIIDVCVSQQTGWKKHGTRFGGFRVVLVHRITRL